MRLGLELTTGTAKLQLSRLGSSAADRLQQALRLLAGWLAMCVPPAYA